MQHAPVSASMAAQWWDSKIGKGNKNAKYKGLTREQYIKGVAGNKTGDGFGKERVLIRKSSAYAAADTQVKKIKAQQAQLNKLVNGNKNGAKNAGTKNTNNGFSNVRSTGGGTSRTGRGGNGGGSTGGSTPSQKDYASTYGGGSSRPTQVIIQIDKLANFDRTMIAKDANDQQIIAMVENKISEALMMLSGAALNTVGSVIAQGVNQA